MSGVAERQLRWFNELSDEEVIGALLLVSFPGVGYSGRGAAPVYRRLLLAAADDTWMALRPEDWLEALDAHPRIGERGGKSAEFSKREQAGFGVAGDDVQAAIASGNLEYEDRFGHVFLISAEGRSAEEILANLRSRLDNDADTELRIAAEEHRRITRLRLQRLLS